MYGFKSNKIVDNAECRRLNFLWAFCSACHMSTKDIGAAIDVSPEAVLAIVRRGDIRLEYIRKIVESAPGNRKYRFHIRLEDPSDSPEIIEKKRLRIAAQPYPRQLDFLFFFLQDRKMTKLRLSQVLGVTQYTVNAWSKNDDMNYSRVHQVADALRARLVVEILPVDDGAPAPGAGQVSRVVLADSVQLVGKVKKEC